MGYGTGPLQPAPVMQGGPGIITRNGLGQTATETEIVQAINRDRERSHLVRLPRREKNRKNWDFVHMQQDWSHKRPGQARIFLPDLVIAVYQAAAAIENQLINFSNWFSVETPGGQPLEGLDPDDLRLILQEALTRLWKPGSEVETVNKFSTVLADCIILALVESEVTLKVYGAQASQCIYELAKEPAPDPIVAFAESAVRGDGPTPDRRLYEQMASRIKRGILQRFRLAIEPIPFEDAYPDPSPLNRFFVHEVTRHVSELRANAKYDPVAVAAVARGCAAAEEQFDKDRRSGQTGTTQQATDPNQVRLREFWGEIHDAQGNVLERDVLAVVALNQLLLPPEPFPMWHGYRPIVRAVALRTPGGAPTHKAYLDHAVPAAEAENEVTSLLVDGATRAVTGITQTRREMLLDPGSISKGIPPGFNAVLKPNQPAGQKFMERVDVEVQFPSYGVEIANRLGRARQVGMVMNDLRLGDFPPRQTKATEIVEISESALTLFENLAVRLEEQLIEPTLQLCWMTLWQHLDLFVGTELEQMLGTERALLMQRKTPEERFLLMTQGVKFKVRGLRQLMSRMRDFEKARVILNSLQSPAVAAAFNRRYSTERLLEKMLRGVNLDPTDLEYRAGEPPSIPLELILRMQGGGGAPGALVAPSGAEADMAVPNPTGDRGSQV